VSPIKGQVKRKTPLHEKNCDFFSLVLSLSHQHSLALLSPFFAPVISFSGAGHDLGRNMRQTDKQSLAEDRLFFALEVSRGTSLTNWTYVYLTCKEFLQLQKETHPNDGWFQLEKVPHTINKIQPVVIIFYYLFALNSPDNDMMQGSRRIQSGLSWHASPLCSMISAFIS
jgi:hypothetical protein